MPKAALCAMIRSGERRRNVRPIFNPALSVSTMPHCILEYTANIVDEPIWADIFKNIHAILIATGEWHSADMKSRAVELHNYYIGNGNPHQAFVTLSIQILTGRSDSLKKSISESCLKALAGHFPLTLKQLQTSITVQVADIHGPSYCRRLNYQS